jgi:hypothetical protein
MGFRIVPEYNIPLTDKGSTQASYYRLFQDLHIGRPPSGEVVVSIGASPFIYTAKIKGNMIVSAGSVISILISRSGTFYGTGLTQGLFSLAAGDQLKVVFTVTPNLVFLPT